MTTPNADEGRGTKTNADEGRRTQEAAQRYGAACPYCGSSEIARPASGSDANPEHVISGDYVECLFCGKLWPAGAQGQDGG